MAVFTMKISIDDSCYISKGQKRVYFFIIVVFYIYIYKKD